MIRLITTSTSNPRPQALARRNRLTSGPRGERGGATQGDKDETMNQLAIQNYLRLGGTLETLAADYSINVYRHPELPLVGFKYDQISSPKFDPIVRDCRGIVLEDGTWNVVAKPFRRFYNAGEDPGEFEWSDSSCTAKEDGSLILLYHYAGDWHVNTSGSFGLGRCGTASRSWRDVFWEVSNLDLRRLDPTFTYIFELCTPYNRVVRGYPESTVFLLAMFDAIYLEELWHGAVQEEAKKIGVGSPEVFTFATQDEITDFLEERSKTDPTFEGIVARDRYDRRLKIKSKSYVRLHRMLDNGNLMRWDRIVPVVLAGEAGEVLAYFPEATRLVTEAADRMAAGMENLTEIWRRTWKIESQRDFAQAIIGQTPFTGILFTLRKELGPNQTEAALWAKWRQSGEVIVKHLFKDQPADILNSRP